MNGYAENLLEGDPIFMAENKKSFLLYCDLIHTVGKMPDDKAGILLKHILAYVNDENPVTEDLIIELTFEPIKQQLKRDLVKWEKFVAKQAANGSLGGRPPKEKEEPNANPENPTLILEKPEEPKKAVTVNVNDSVTVNENETVIVKEEEKKKEKRKKDVALPLSDYQICVDFWLKEVHQGWTFGGQQGKAMKSILTKLNAIIKDVSPPPEVFKMICLNLPEWYKTKDLPVIDSKFNEIITEIKNSKNGKSKTTIESISNRKSIIKDYTDSLRSEEAFGNESAD